MTRPLPKGASRPDDTDLFRPVELLAKLFEGPEGAHSGLEHLLARLEWKDRTR